MRAFAQLLFCLVLSYTVAAPAVGQVDLAGDWSLEATAVLPVPEVKGEIVEDCTFAGTASVATKGSEFSGVAELELTAGVAGCPGLLMADLSGAVNVALLPTGMVVGELMDPDFGTASFNGTTFDDGTVAGSYAVQTGPFAGASGTWVAAPLVAAPALPIPTLERTSLIALALLIALAAGFLLTRRSL